jgi:membrane-bound inhibitor of C-type lysozyme
MRAAIALAALALAACQTPCPAPETGPRTATFHCEDGSDLLVTFTRSPDSARVVQEGYTTLDLPARISGSGFRYAEEGAELRGRGSEAYWTRPGAAETICRQAQ